MKTVWTNGCFDILHRGHLELFKYAKSLGDHLVVGVDDDERVRAFKGEGRPINTLEDRMEMLRSIKYIDEVRWFDVDSELETEILLSGAKVIVVGSDYSGKKVIGARHVEEVKFFDRVGEYSTTRIIENG